jgi:hypothetical protein
VRNKKSGGHRWIQLTGLLRLPAALRLATTADSPGSPVKKKEEKTKAGKRERYRYALRLCLVRDGRGDDGAKKNSLILDFQKKIFKKDFRL